MGWLAPAFLAGLAGVSIPVLIHLIHRERRETVAFPSLMFLRKIPYRSVRRQKLRHLALLALRCLALAIVAGAFARPFFERNIIVPPSVSDAREVVIVVDRSYSMGNGGRWARAVSAALTVAREARSTDRVSVVSFASTASQVTEPTSNVSRLERAIQGLRPGSEPTRFASGVRMAAQILSASELPRREIILISDFHRFGWAPGDETPLPAGAVVKTVDVSRKEDADVAVAHVAVARSRSGDRSRATVTARLTNLGTTARTVEASLELAGRRVETRSVTVPPRAAAQAVFRPMTVSAGATRGVVRITRDSQPANDAFFFVTTEDAGASALIVEPPQPRTNQSLFITRALSVADDPPVNVDVKSASAITPADVRGRSLIVLNEADLSAGAAELVRAQVDRGSLLLIAPGEGRGSSWPADWRTRLPATLGQAVDRRDGASWVAADFSNALFEPFRLVAGAGGAGGSADFSSVTTTRYRTLTPAGDSAQVIARLDDGAPLLVERAIAGGSGRVMMWASSLDARWTNFPFHPLWVPLLHRLAQRSIVGKESSAWVVAPHMLDLSRETDAVIESPSGQRARANATERASFELSERGFYEVRGASTAIGAGRPVAVNVDLAESDLSHFDPGELVAALTARPRAGAASARVELPGTAQDLERRQSIWWYLLVAVALVLAAEALFANRLSRPVLMRSASGDDGVSGRG
ncbi:MAG TPA: VWA domain-containing protein [Gemmatimonadaceae bacterium]|nr:VWA domain-containing protein [Gemmatimonadaceae bacterium]